MIILNPHTKNNINTIASQHSNQLIFLKNLSLTNQIGY